MLEFGTRHVIAMNYTRYIALPKEWLQTHRINPGDLVKISLAEDGNLKISRPGAE